VPVWNEDPEVLDRVLYGLFSQSRLPDYVQVVDDGSTKADYSEVSAYWKYHHPPDVNFSWISYAPNRGKRFAQATTFHRLPGDIFVTLDSDTTLEHRAIEEGLKPFASRKVMSVAGVEIAMNSHQNLLTRISSLRQIAWQYTQCSALSVAGNVLVNRGTFALYRAELVRENLHAYVTETFLGRPVTFSDTGPGHPCSGAGSRERAPRPFRIAASSSVLPSPTSAASLNHSFGGRTGSAENRVRHSNPMAWRFRMSQIG